MNIAVALVTKNNEKTIKSCLESLNDIKNKEIYYTDLGSTDSTEKYLKKFNRIEKISNKIYENKNNLIKNINENKIFFINPFEEMINGYDEIEKIIQKDKNFKVLVLNEEIINKSVRIINKNVFFQNEIYEEIYDKNSDVCNILLKVNKESNVDIKEEEIISWINKNRTNPKPYYYMACHQIKNKNYIEFKKYSDRYIFLENNKNLPSIIMTKYYQSLIDLHVFKNFKNSINNIIFCIDKMPTMAEFWCVLGDINFKLNKYQKAIYFYENAITLGEKRKSNDEFSIEIKKYKIYPNKMIDLCKKSL